MSDDWETNFRCEMGREHDHGKRRISREEFESLPTRDPQRYHMRWREIRDGRWVVCYRGTSCGYEFRFFFRPIIVVKAAA